MIFVNALHPWAIYLNPTPYKTLKMVSHELSFQQERASDECVQTNIRAS